MSPVHHVTETNHEGKKKINAKKNLCFSKLVGSFKKMIYF